MSTGPISDAGKGRSKLNALKFGLSSKQLVIERIDGADAVERFAALLHSVVEHYAPANPIADFKVRRVPANLWRLERTDRAEAAMLEEAFLCTAQDDLMRPLQLPATTNETIPFDAAASELHSQRLQHLIKLLLEFEAELERDKGLSAESLNILMTRFGRSSFVVDCVMVCIDAMSRLSERTGEPDADRVANSIEQAISMISEKRHQLSEICAQLANYEHLQQEARRETYCVPTPANFEKLWRFRAAINRELESDLAYLDGTSKRGKKKL